MTLWQGRSKRKKTGGRLVRNRKKRKYEIGGGRLEIGIGRLKSKRLGTRGGNFKYRLMTAQEANVLDPDTKKSKTVKILKVVENPANPHYVRRNIITKGAVIETEAGKARVTSRPGQDGAVDAVLLK